MDSEMMIRTIAGELHLAEAQVDAAARLLKAGGTVPFIARYRKEATGSLDEVAITAIRDRADQLEALDRRRQAIIKSLRERDLLSGELAEKIDSALTLSALEDVYLPYRPKRRTKASMAREKGLEPLAQCLFDQADETVPEAAAAPYVAPEKGVESVEDALSESRYIMAEWISEDQTARERMRALFRDKGVFKADVIPGKEKEGAKYQDYFEWEEPISGAPSHRILALRRGEKEGVLDLRITPSLTAAMEILEELFIKGDNPASGEVRKAIQDGYKRLLSVSMETESRLETKKRADEAAIQVFAENLRALLLTPPMGQKRVMAIDPGIRTGCKVACLDSQGKLLGTDTIYPFASERERTVALKTLKQLLERYRVEAVAVGNGTAGRETEAFIRGLGLPENIPVVMVNESGASVYSASAAAREEFPDLDLTFRGAVSIGRRLMDPLAELVKIDPKAIGVGQYQHDVNQNALKRRLDDGVMSCVNAVGVDVNTVSEQLLSYVSGIGPQLARQIVRHRNEHGPFRSRLDLKDVPRLGPRAFEQAAGFLRINGGENPLDASAVHPESYGIVEVMARDLGCRVADLLADDALRKQIDLTRYVTDGAGLPTLIDILHELERPGRDPRESFDVFSFAEGVTAMADLEIGMKLPGVVTNVTAFGAFVDVGVHQDGLVHISQLTDRFVKDPNDVVRVQQKVTVTVLDVDLERNRISLSMKENPEAKPAHGSREKPPSRHRKKPTQSQRKGPTAFNNPFQKALR
ncbi:MAG: Tex family protein [Deltaproteobacteria bacterium]|nr:Tex family protein [Deltaproteobacteria bacterium]